VNITSVSLRNATLSQTSFAGLLGGIGELDGITEMDLSGIDFVDANGTDLDLQSLYVMDDLTDLWLVDTRNLDALGLDVLLDNLATIEGADTEGILHMTYANFDGFNIAGSGLLAAWDAELGHHVAFSEPLLGDLNLDGEVNGLDLQLFVDVLLSGPYQTEADMNEDRVINGLDVDSFMAAIDQSLGGDTQQIPEPSTLLFALCSLGVVGGWRKWGA
jgi:uncharacterized protein YjbI with pentapeptide repeats